MGFRVTSTSRADAAVSIAALVDAVAPGRPGTSGAVVRPPGRPLLPALDASV